MLSQTKIHNTYFLIMMTTIAALAGVLFGYDTGVMSGAILFIREEFQLSPQFDGIVMGAVLFGAIFGALASGRLTDFFGRKALLLACSLLFIMGSLATALTPGIITLIVGRVIVGIAIGIASYAAPLYISEIAPAQHRGLLVSLNQVAISMGILISYITDYALANHIEGWRFMLGIGILPAIFLFVGIIVLPYSPRWLVSKKRIQQARKILYQLRGNSTVVVEAELAAIEGIMKNRSNNWRLLFSAKLRPVLLVGVGLAVIQQATGINTVLYYAPTIFKLSGFYTNIDAMALTIIIGIVFVFFTVLSLLFIDRWGRKPLLITGLLGMSLSLLALSYVFHHHALELGIKPLALASIFVYIACFAFSLGSIVWLMISEIYPLLVRGSGASIATACNWMTNMLVAGSFLSLVQALGTSGAFNIYLVLCLLSIIFVVFYVPETKGISLEGIESNLYAGYAARDLGQQQLDIGKPTE